MISHDHKIIFIHIPKCAGRSICDMFNQRFDHFTARYYAEEYTRQWATYNKFTIVRNPYERLVSMYHYILEHRRHSLEDICVSNYGFKGWLTANINNFKEDFKYDSPEGQRGTDGDLGSPFWFSSQYRRISNEDGDVYGDGELAVFKIEDMRRVSEYISKVSGLYYIPLLNKSNHDAWVNYYDKSILKILNDFPPLKEDLLAFNYKIVS